jgi:hypothetical protein
MKTIVFIACLLFVYSTAFALLTITDKATANSISLISASQETYIYTDSTDNWLVQRSAQLLQQDIETVTSIKVSLIHTLSSAKGNLIIIGSIPSSLTIQNLAAVNKIIISFNHTGNGLATNDGEELTYFAIAGDDKKFVWVKAKIEGDKVIVWNDAISHPVSVRYVWADNPDGANLINQEGLPASPFRTDH